MSEYQALGLGISLGYENATLTASGAFPTPESHIQVPRHQFQQPQLQPQLQPFSQIEQPSQIQVQNFQTQNFQAVQTQAQPPAQVQQGFQMSQPYQPQPYQMANGQANGHTNMYVAGQQMYKVPDAQWQAQSTPQQQMVSQVPSQVQATRRLHQMQQQMAQMQSQMAQMAQMTQMTPQVQQTTQFQQTQMPQQTQMAQVPQAQLQAQMATLQQAQMQSQAQALQAQAQAQAFTHTQTPVQGSQQFAPASNVPGRHKSVVSSSPAMSSLESPQFFSPDVGSQVSPTQNLSSSNPSPHHTTVKNPTTPSTKFNIPTPRTESNSNSKFQHSGFAFKEFDSEYGLQEYSMESLTPVEVLFEETESKLKLEDILKDDPLFEIYESATPADTSITTPCASTTGPVSAPLSIPPSAPTSVLSSAPVSATGSTTTLSKRGPPKLKKMQSLSSVPTSNIKKKKPTKSTKSFSFEDCASTFQSLNTINIIQENFTTKSLVKSKSMDSLGNNRDKGKKSCFTKFSLNT